ncbi:MAG TPA: hypothetical protein VE619_08750 [Nitrososphaeraceae archaeon]|nr:hypothetical protein [Nitrososphaeraceae archaeon]
MPLLIVIIGAAQVSMNDKVHSSIVEILNNRSLLKNQKLHLEFNTSSVVNVKTINY